MRLHDKPGPLAACRREGATARAAEGFCPLTWLIFLRVVTLSYVTAQSVMLQGIAVPDLLEALATFKRLACRQVECPVTPT